VTRHRALREVEVRLALPTGDVDARPAAARACNRPPSHVSTIPLQGGAPSVLDILAAYPPRSRLGGAAARSGPATPVPNRPPASRWPAQYARWRPNRFPAASTQRDDLRRSSLRRRLPPGGQGCYGGAVVETSFWGTPALWRGERVSGNMRARAASCPGCSGAVRILRCYAGNGAKNGSRVSTKLPPLVAPGGLDQ
jgi:hypothetical protein